MLGAPSGRLARCAGKGEGMKIKPPNRRYLLKAATRLFCPDPDCQTLRRVTDSFAGVNVVQLDCNHRRRIESKNEEEKCRPA